MSVSASTSSIAPGRGPVIQRGERCILDYLNNSKTNCLICKAEVTAPHGLSYLVDRETRQEEPTLAGKRILAVRPAYTGNAQHVGICNAGFVHEGCLAASSIACCIFCKEGRTGLRTLIPTHFYGDDQEAFRAHPACPESRPEICIDACCATKVPDPEAVPADLIQKEIEAGARELR